MGHKRNRMGRRIAVVGRLASANTSYVEDFNNKAQEIIKQKAVSVTDQLATEAPREVPDNKVPKGLKRYRFPDGYICIAKNVAKAVKMRKEYILKNNA